MTEHNDALRGHIRAIIMPKSPAAPVKAAVVLADAAAREVPRMSKKSPWILATRMKTSVECPSMPIWVLGVAIHSRWRPCYLARPCWIWEVAVDSIVFWPVGAWVRPER
jgi:hypothetical protein